MDALLIIGGVIVAGFVAWKLFLGAVKGVSKAVSAGVAEGRGALPPAPMARSVAPPPEAAEETADLQNELVMATYHLGVSELERDPKAHGYEDLDENAFKDADPEGTVSMKAIGEVIKKLSPVNPARLSLEQLAEDHARKALGADEAANLAKLHEKTRVYEILSVGAKVRAERS
jgi:hypothetical protein